MGPEMLGSDIGFPSTRGSRSTISDIAWEPIIVKCDRNCNCKACYDTGRAERRPPRSVRSPTRNREWDELVAKASVALGGEGGDSSVVSQFRELVSRGNTDESLRGELSAQIQYLLRVYHVFLAYRYAPNHPMGDVY